MFIYIVKPGDSLFAIANRYQVSLEALEEVNGLPTGTLVQGQDLIIPTSVYIVQPGDSLYSISRMSLTSVETLRQANGLQSDQLTVGMRIYLPPRTKYPVENLSFMLPTTPANEEELIRRYANISTYIGVFEYRVTVNGGLSSLNDENIIRLLRRHRLAPLATVTNLTAGGFSPELTRRVLQDPIIRNRLIESIVDMVAQKNYAGVVIDFERVRREERDLFSGFLRSLGERLRPQGLVTSAAVPPKTNDEASWLRGYDYGGIGAAVDFVFIMAYDWHETHTAPGPVAPIGEVRQTIEYASRFMRRKKIILGFARYGYDWDLQNPDDNRAVSVQQAIQLAFEHQVPIQYSEEYQQAHFSYTDSRGRRHVVWFENVRARVAKFNLVIQYQLKGLGAWQVGLSFPQSAYLVNEFFAARKLL